VRFSYVRYDAEAQVKQQEFKALFEAIEAHAEKVLGASRPKSLLMTALEEAYLWTGKAIRDEQIARDGAAAEQKERGAE
jgi:hypothetical protein